MSAIFTDIQQFERRLSLPNGFYDALLKEDDWSFVVKMSALFESACTHILSVRLRAPELEDSFSFLDQANTKCGRVALLKSVNAISKEQATFLYKLAELRNKLTHRVENVSFQFATYVSGFDKPQQKSFIEAFGHGVKDELNVRGLVIEKSHFVLENPKIAMWLTAAEILACLYLEIDVVKLAIDKEALSNYMNLTTGSS
jgi:hypothetical protein